MAKLRYKNAFIDGQEYKIPFVIFNEDKKETLLVTGGIDGDEYAGIKAAYNLINVLEKFKSDYRIIVVPLVNFFGYKANVSHNPIDGKYPKHIYPGKKNGTSSEQIIYELEEFINQSFLWVDLHSGSTDESLKPFIWTWKTKNKIVNEIILSKLHFFPNENIIYQKKSIKKVEELAKRNISYVMLESGELGKENKEDILRHVEWVEKILLKKTKQDPVFVYENVQFFKLKNSTEWMPKVSPGRINAKEVIGYLDTKAIVSNKLGLILYMKKNMIMSKNSEFLAIAYDKIKI